MPTHTPGASTHTPGAHARKAGTDAVNWTLGAQRSQAERSLAQLEPEDVNRDRATASGQAQQRQTGLQEERLVRCHTCCTLRSCVITSLVTPFYLLLYEDRNPFTVSIRLRSNPCPLMVLCSAAVGKRRLFCYSHNYLQQVSHQCASAPNIALSTFLPVVLSKRAASSAMLHFVLTKGAKTNYFLRLHPQSWEQTIVRHSGVHKHTFVSNFFFCLY